MKKAIAILACCWALVGGVYFAASKWAIRHQTLNLFDAARQRPVAVDLAVRRDYEMKANAGYWRLPVAVLSNRQYRQEHGVFIPRQCARGKGLSGCQHSAGSSDRSAIDDQG